MALNETFTQRIMLIAVACAVTSTGLLAWSLFHVRGAAPISPPPEAAEVRDWREYAAAGRRLGRLDAPVTIIEWGDYECGYCGEFARKTLRELEAKYPGKVAVVYRHFPLPMHRLAYAAAQAAECAGAEGKFAEFHDLLFRRQDSLGILSFDELASRAGIRDLERFHQCLRQPARSSAIESDIAAGKRLRITGTPTLIIDGMMYAAALPFHTVDSIVSTMLARGK